MQKSNDNARYKSTEKLYKYAQLISQTFMDGIDVAGNNKKVSEQRIQKPDFKSLLKLYLN